MHTLLITIDAGTIIDCCSFDHCYCYWERCDGFEKKKNDKIVVNATGCADALPRRRRSRVPLFCSCNDDDAARVVVVVVVVVVVRVVDRCLYYPLIHVRQDHGTDMFNRPRRWWVDMLLW